MKYKPLYKVTLDGKVIGYVEDKEKMQEKINEFANNLEGNITSIKIESMPTFELELVSNVGESETKEEEVLAAVEENAEIMVRTYAIKLDGVEKASVNSMEEAESVVEEIKSEVAEGVELELDISEEIKDKKEVDSTETTTEIAKTEINKDVEVKVKEYEEEQARIKAEEEAAAEAARIAAASVSSRSTSSRSATTSTTYGTAGASVAATGATFMTPVYGAVISSPYGYRSSGFHKGIDLATSTGTPIYAAASGTVTFSGWNSTGYGYMVIIDHGNGYQTYYAHCSALYVTVGTYVSQGQNIAAVGSTGNSTGPHCHFQIMYNGTPQNPSSYLY